jgi:hypothetical protein
MVLGPVIRIRVLIACNHAECGILASSFACGSASRLRAFPHSPRRWRELVKQKNNPENDDRNE